MIPKRHVGRPLVATGLVLASACFPGERPTAIHLECDDDGCRCEANFADCDGDPSTGCELPTHSDRNNCGGCDVECHSDCSNGQCATEGCDPNFADCHNGPGCESDLANDVDHCGACDHSCLGGGCAERHCEPYELVDRGFYPLSLAADDTHLYFCETISGTIMRAPFDQGEVEVVASDQTCGWLDYDFRAGLIATGGGHVYWTTGRWVESGYRERLHALALDTGQSWIIEPQTIADGPCCLPQGGPGCTEDATIEACVCADDSYCCDTEWDSWCTDLLVSLGCGSCAPELSYRALWATDDQLLVAMADDADNAVLTVMSAGGADPQEVASTVAEIDHVALVGDHAFWIEPISISNETGIDSIILRASTTAQSPAEAEVFAFGQGIDNLTASVDTLYWTGRDDELYIIARKQGGGMVELVHASKRPLATVQADTTHVYWTENVFDIRVGMYRVALDTGETTTFTSSHYVYAATSSPTIVAWVDYSDRIFGLAK
ncbi:MAG: hypothetical protein DRI90_05525 [Deltaproteobacteria bacterium]|nr:MAG: hypothetical protein DRI90_05525 [Deltaproteobacteria bacterium]